MHKSPESRSDRRPLTSRNTAWARILSSALANRGVAPNTVSALSMVFAALALGCGAAIGAGSSSVHGPDSIGDALWLMGLALFCQLRLLCNLLDGMIAIEAGRSTPDGGVWNELPDRIADILILVGVGLAIDQASLGWAAGAVAVLTAYVRELGKGLDGVVDFSGPLAKPQRMAVVTAACVLAAFIVLASVVGDAVSVSAAATLLEVALWGVVVGSALTALRRAVRLVGRLRRQ